MSNLPNIVTAGGIWSDAKRIELGLACELIGMSEIKQRRLEELAVSCHPGTTVGQYVPFYFCPRSITLYILHKGNHPDISYRQGQNSLIHLEADLQGAVETAQLSGIRWAFSTSNAGARYTNFYASMHQLGEVNWPAVAATDFRGAAIKEAKQAEFLWFEHFPWTMIKKIGVACASTQDQVLEMLAIIRHQPDVSIEPDWYF